MNADGPNKLTQHADVEATDNIPTDAGTKDTRPKSTETAKESKKHSPLPAPIIYSSPQPCHTPTPRPFVVKGRAFCGSQADGSRRDRQREGSSREMPGAVPVADTADTEEDILKVGKKPLSSRVEKSKKESSPELARSFDLIRTVHQFYPNTEEKRGPSERTPSRQAFVGETLQRQSGTQHSPLKFRPRSKAGMTAEGITRQDSEVPLNGLPPSPTFRLKDKQLWKPVVSRLGRDPFDLRPAKKVREREEDRHGEDGVRGHSVVTRISSKMLLDVVLPRESRSREARLCSRHDLRSPSPPLPKVYHSGRAPSPPPPPPSSAPTAIEDDGLSNEGLGENTPTDGHERGNACRSAGFVQPGGSESLKSPQSIHFPKLLKSSEDQCELNVHTLPADASAIGATMTQAGTQPFAANSSSEAASTDATGKVPPNTGSPEDTDVGTGAGGKPVTVPPLVLGPRMVTAESTFHNQHQPGETAQHAVATCRRSTHCDLFGPGLCTDCEAALFRQQFSARQDLVYPRITVFPRHMVASQKFKATKEKGSHQARLAKVNNSSTPRWPYASSGQLRCVLTDLDVCKRIAERNRRPKLSGGF